MHILLIYIFKAAIFQTMIMACYGLLLRKDTFYKMNRWYLFGGILFSWMVPFINFDITALFKGREEAPVTVVYQYLPNLSFHEIDQPWWQQYSFNDYLLFAVMTGSVIMLVRLLLQYLSLIKLGNGQRTVFDEYNIQLLNIPSNPFSFGRTIYINPALHSEQEMEEILEHELVHIRQRHSIDMMFASFNRCIFWWNPAAWMLNRIVRDNLEYIADRIILEKGFDRKHYQYHLLRISQVAYSNSIAHHFNFSNLKKRIVMMNKGDTNPLQKIKWLLLLPIVTVMLLSFNYRSSMGEQIQTIINSVSYNRDTVPVPPPPASGKKGVLPADVKSIHVTDKKVEVKLRDGKEEKYDLEKAEEKQKFQEKYGKGMAPAPPHPRRIVATYAYSDGVSQKEATSELVIVDSVKHKPTMVYIHNPNAIKNVKIVDEKVSESLKDDVEPGKRVVATYNAGEPIAIIVDTVKISNQSRSDREKVVYITDGTLKVEGNVNRDDLNKATDAIILIDGKESTHEELKKLDPKKIASINVIKNRHNGKGSSVIVVTTVR